MYEAYLYDSTYMKFVFLYLFIVHLIIFYFCCPTLDLKSSQIETFDAWQLFPGLF